ncbi:hypothetical protein [Campylobacter sp. VTCC 70190]|uniref:hypothetical protein n=1 Tax=Campylobacter sp. VTCC 70190 TaxID=3392118 RepID=UPI00398ECF11
MRKKKRRAYEIYRESTGMIFVSIQGEQGGQESAENGKILKNQQEKIDALLDFLSVNKINANEEFFGSLKSIFSAPLCILKRMFIIENA